MVERKPMRTWKKMVLLASGILVAAAAVFLVPTLWFTPWSIDHFYTRVFLQFALRRPMLLSSLRILEPMGIDFHNDDLDDFSVAFMLDEARRLDRDLRILRGYNRAKMPDRERLSADVLEWFMADAQEAQRFMFHDYPVNQFEGLQSTLPDFMVNTHQIHREKDARNYIARLSKFGAAIDQIIEGLNARRARGILPPRFVIRRVPIHDEILCLLKW
jgi:uncharacterized protein (DUF885 family)